MEKATLNILLIEDNEGFARLISELLREAGATRYHVEVTERLAEGIKRATKGDIDLVLLDLGLPDSKGLDTFIKARAGISNIPIVVLTAMDDDELALEAVWAGAQDFLVKGKFDGKMLAHTLRYAIVRENVRVKSEEEHDAYRRDREISALHHVCSDGPLGDPIAESRLQDFISRYAEMMELALNRRKTDSMVSRGLEAIAKELAGLRAGPDSVVQIHETVLRDKTEGVPPRRALPYLEAGRQMVLELMGYLVTCYLKELEGGTRY